jgi:hypothetical protein
MKRARETFKCDDCGGDFFDDMEFVLHVSLHAERPVAAVARGSHHKAEQRKEEQQKKALPMLRQVSLVCAPYVDGSFVELSRVRKSVNESFLLFCRGETRLFFGREKWGSCGYRNTQTILAAASCNKEVGGIEHLQVEKERQFCYFIHFCFVEATG